jgi:pimeloyl-ACP methyl ester carboxylesterase
LEARKDLRRFIAPDLLGHGESATPRGDYTLGGYANGLRDLLGALGYRHGSLVGHSLGGGVAMQFAYQFPESCDRLALVSSGGLGQTVSPLLRAVTLPGAEYVLPVIAHQRVMEFGGWLGGLAGKVGLSIPVELREFGQHFESLVDPGRRNAFVHTVRSVIDGAGQRVSGAEKLYLAGDVPTLIVWGGRDPMIPVGHAHRAAELIPHATLEIFDEAGHFPHCDDPARFTDVLVRFLDTTTAARLDVDDLATRLAIEDE